MKDAAYDLHKWELYFLPTKVMFSRDKLSDALPSAPPDPEMIPSAPPLSGMALN